jgi:alkanesulfonate monooxygenase SsuD/methylene tetrahydromethanopterin reductase-like flavin-dependent oxidoreductase (luciferase family)
MRSERLRFGISVPQRIAPGENAQSIAARVKAIEALGFESCWFGDHTGQGRDFGALPMLAFTASHTDRVLLGTSVMLSALRHPVQLAADLATVDRLSGGRLTPGFGMGNATYYHLMDMPVEHRSSRFEEGIMLMKRLWTEGTVSFAGRVFNFEQVSCPEPASNPHPPIFFGGHAPAALDRAVRLGDGWIGAAHSSTGQLETEVQAVRDLIAEKERDPDTFVLGKRVMIDVDTTREGAQRRLDANIGETGTSRGAEAVGVFGSVDDCIEGLSQIADTGVDLIILAPSISDFDQQMYRLVSDVLPKV